MSKFVLPKKYIIFCKKNAIADKSKYDSSLHEKHHILPKCKGGTNDEDNLCYLPIEKHFEAHLLLAKLTNDAKLWGILYMMLKTRVKHTITLKNKTLYAEIRNNYKKAVAEESKKRWKDPKYRAARIKTTQDAWKRPGYKENHRQKMNKYFNNPEYIANLSKKAKERWKDPEYAKKCNFGRDRPEVRQKIIKKLKETLSTKEARALKSLRSKQNWQRPEYRAKMKAALKAYWKRKHKEQEQSKKGGPCAE